MTFTSKERIKFTDANQIIAFNTKMRGRLTCNPVWRPPQPVRLVKAQALHVSQHSPSYPSANKTSKEKLSSLSHVTFEPYPCRQSYAPPYTLCKYKAQSGPTSLSQGRGRRVLFQEVELSVNTIPPLPSTNPPGTHHCPSHRLILQHNTSPLSGPPSQE